MIESLHMEVITSCVRVINLIAHEHKVGGFPTNKNTRKICTNHYLKTITLSSQDDNALHTISIILDIFHELTTPMCITLKS